MGARKGASVSTRMRSAGAKVAASRMAMDFGVGEVAGEGEVEAGVEGAAGLLEVAGEAVHDAGEAVWGPVLGDEGRGGLPRRRRGRTFALACGVASSEVRQWMMMGLRASAAIFIWAMKASCWMGMSGFSRW